MTFFHLGNCVVLSYAPYFITYRYSGLSEYSALLRCVKAGGAYFFTQLVKMLLLATFFPATEAEDAETNDDIVTDLVKATVELIDLLGIYYTVTRVVSKGEMRIMATSIGWGSADFLGTRLLPLWFGARGSEFDWIYLQNSLDCNINLLFLVSTTTLLWLWSRNDFSDKYLPLLAVMLGLLSYRSILFQVMSTTLGLGGWMMLLVKAASALLVAIVSLQLYCGIVSI
ncbi:BOS complex subunit TMEM147-like [Dysidea avara]|uniref:BOS complex subunit TMEM147-like n=1 Tax=Dysidea avara TaxID=196820 RepID=UPI003316CB94